ncbi:hypothetical protein KY317_02605 [Candidatus Woesearchaeota archaeon]|nr:hypothetical protein [Candidatus Woesearchaeota archaeon]
MLIKSKKATVMYWALFGLLIAICIYIIMTYRATPAQIEEYKGEAPISLIKANQIADAKMIYIDLSSEFSVRNAAEFILENGGSCGDINGYNIWNNREGSCISADSLKKKFIERIKINMAEYLKETRLKIEYDVSFDETRVIGTTEEEIITKFFIGPLPKGETHTKPNFAVDFGYDVEEYNNMILQANNLIIKCKPEVDVLKCARESKPNWNVSDIGEERIFGFEAESYKFALYFPFSVDIIL